MERALRNAEQYCQRALPRVSRTFALNIRILPQPLRAVVRQAYLFCRIADTVEDSPHLPAGDRPALLAAYRNLFPLAPDWEVRSAAWAARFTPLASAGADHALCARAPDVFRAFAAMPPAYRAPIEACVEEMTVGMESFAARRAASADGTLHLESVADLEAYCHYVAGTVGEMLCALFAIARPGWTRERFQRMRDLAGRFGLAMQLTNILQDVAEDAHRGDFYVPRAVAARHRLRPDDILDPARREAATAVVRELGRHAAGALDAALEFTLLIPRREARLRLFCLWPLFLAVRTLGRALRDERSFVPGQRPRIGRNEVRRCLGRTVLAVGSDGALRRLYARECRTLAPTLG